MSSAIYAPQTNIFRFPPPPVQKKIKIRMWRAAVSVVLFVVFGACLGWSIVAVVTQGRVVAAVACMCGSLVGSFGMLVCYLARTRPAPVTRRIEVRSGKDKDARSPRMRSVVVSETAVVCVAVECGSSPSGARSSPGMWVFDTECTMEPS